MQYLKTFALAVLVGFSTIGLTFNPAQASTIEIGSFTGDDTITFDDLAPSLTINTQYSGLGVSFVNWRSINECSWHNNCSFSEIFAHSSPSGSGFLQSIQFDSAQQKVGFELGSNINMTATIQILLAGNLLDQFVYTQSHGRLESSRIFRGFEDTGGIDELRFAFSGGTHHINNLTFSELSPVPVPAAVWLFGTALIGLVGFSKKRKAA